MIAVQDKATINGKRFERFWLKGQVLLRGWRRQADARPTRELIEAAPIKSAIRPSTWTEKAWRARVSHARRALSFDDLAEHFATREAKKENDALHAYLRQPACNSRESVDSASGGSI